MWRSTKSTLRCDLIVREKSGVLSGSLPSRADVFRRVVLPSLDGEGGLIRTLQKRTRARARSLFNS